MGYAAATHDARPGLILPVVLVILMLLAMVGAMFSFFTSAELGAAAARANRLQTRLAAEAGIQRVLLLLREHRGEMSYWWNNPELYGIQIWPPATEGDGLTSQDRGAYRTGSGQNMGMTEAKTPGERWRYSLMAVDLDKLHEEDRPIRSGIQDECGKLNINWATPEQLRALFSAVLEPEAPVEELVDCLLDWRSPGETPRPAGAKSQYYQQLSPPYSCGNAPLKTIEELLLVKGFNGRVVFGEDYNRNGILDASEDDGMATFPPDNADGQLNVGLLPYVTIYSMGWDRASDNKPKIYLNSKPEDLEKILPLFLDADLAEFIVQARRSNVTFISPAQLAGSIKIGKETVTSPGSPEGMLLAMDRLTTIPRPPNMGPLGSMIAVPLPHVINVNTAPPPVLACLGLNAEQIQQLVAARRQLGDKEKISPAWLVNEGIMTPEELARFTGPQLNQIHIVTQTWQFTVESVGYGDHVGMVYRLQAVLEVQGQLPIVRYYRDISKLGPGWPIRIQDEGREIISTSH